MKSKYSWFELTQNGIIVCISISVLILFFVLISMLWNRCY